MSLLKAGRTGVTAETPKNILFGAGTIHKNVTYTPTTYKLTTDSAIATGKDYFTRSGSEGSYVYTKVTSPVVGSIGTYYEVDVLGSWNFEDSIIGATQGGSKLSIVPSFVDVEADGAVVLVKGLKVKTGEEASMEINFLEINQDIMKHALIGEIGTSEDPNFTVLQTKPDVTDGDYYDNVAFVGQTLDKRQIIVIMENVLCTSGFESEGKNKEAGVGKYTFTCHAEITGDLQTLPVYIYYPNSTTQGD